MGRQDERPDFFKDSIKYYTPRRKQDGRSSAPVWQSVAFGKLLIIRVQHQGHAFVPAIYRWFQRFDGTDRPSLVAQTDPS